MKYQPLSVAEIAFCWFAVDRGFVDDVEFYFNKPGRISLRSASRLGYSDMGVNRRRMEKIRNLFEGK